MGHKGLVSLDSVLVERIGEDTSHENAAESSRARTGWPSLSPRLPDHVYFAQLNEDHADRYPLHANEKDLLGLRAAPVRRLSFQLGRAAARLAMAKLGVAESPIMRGDHGEPLWPEGVVGTISHGQGLGLAAVARKSLCGGIGMDLEALTEFPGLADQVAFGADREWLDKVSPEERPRRTLQIFSAKESIYKAFFPRVGRYFGFEAVTVRGAPGSCALAAQFVETIDAAYPPTRTFDVECEWYDDLVLTTVVLPPEG